MWHARPACQHAVCVELVTNGMLFPAQHWSAMKRTLILQILFLPVAFQIGLAIQAPTGVIGLAGDQSVVLHWDRSTDASLAGYHVYRSTTGAGGPFSLLNTSLLTGPGYCDLNSKVINGQTNFYYATAVDTSSQESLPSVTLGALPHAFASDDEFLDYVQQTCFDYFWYGANPANGLVPDRSAAGSACSASDETPSHVLSAIGLTDKTARASLRFTMGRTTTQVMVERTVRTLGSL